MNHIIFQIQDDLAVITLNRPEVANGFHIPMCEEILGALELAEKDDSVSFILINAAGKVFSVGGDLVEMKRAVDSGYWQLFRYNPTLLESDKSPLIIDSKDPSADYQEFLMSENRYASLAKQKPDMAKDLFLQNELEASKKREFYKKKAEMLKPVQPATEE